MKLIDLLIKELPQFGGWPVGAECARRYKADRFVCFYDGRDSPIDSYPCISTGCLRVGVEIEEVSHGYYLSEMEKAAVQEWNGAGAPPVGTRCEYSLNKGGTWWPCKIEFNVGTQGVVMSCDASEGIQYVSFSAYGNNIFRPIRTEAERKREEALADLAEALGHAHGLFDLLAIYNSIQSGKVRHITLK